MVEISRLRNVASIPLQDADLGLEWIEFALHPAHKVPTHHFRMVHSRSREELGTINLRVSSSPHVELYAGHVGYSVKTDHRGNRYASRAVRLLIPIAREVGLNPLWITCDPENAASRRTCELAGGELIEIVAVPPTCIIYRNGHRQKCRYRLNL
jgi:predicted acetyltransferase